jgi:hypothetical protein
LEDRVFGHEHATDRNTEARVRIGHEVRADHPFVRRRVRELTPRELFRSFEQRFGEKRARVDAHACRAWEHVTSIADLLDVGLERHGATTDAARWRC